VTVPSSADQALRKLVADGINQGRLGPGARLPTERELVEQLGVPRSAIRRALDGLEQDGLIVRYVVQALRERDPDAAQYHMREHLINVTKQPARQQHHLAHHRYRET
jgi:DNA-binding FadR family transcriptional regulator